MEIKFLKSGSLSDHDWTSYCEAFNRIFEKEYTIDYFKQKYQITIDGYSYHSFLCNESEIVGACTVIPYSYIVEKAPVRIGLVVDVFILTEYREDPYSLFRMYKLLKKEMVNNNIAFTVAVPNDIAYPFWKSIVKWKDVGLLTYYTLPVKLGNVLGKYKSLLNAINRIGLSVLMPLSGLLISKEKDTVIRIDRSVSLLEEHRYTSDHKILTIENAFFSYRIISEHGVVTCYLIDFYNLKSKRKDTGSLRRAITEIIKNEEIDLIIYVGQLRMSQSLLFKVPFAKEPKHLYFMSDLVMPEMVNAAVIRNIANWDFGLFNYDVR